LIRLDKLFVFERQVSHEKDAEERQVSHEKDAEKRQVSHEKDAEKRQVSHEKDAEKIQFFLQDIAKSSMLKVATVLFLFANLTTAVVKFAKKREKREYIIHVIGTYVIIALFI
jgi:hypothetical protein